MQEPRSSGFWVRCAAGLVDLLILAVPLAVFVSFTSVALGDFESISGSESRDAAA